MQDTIIEERQEIAPTTSVKQVHCALTQIGVPTCQFQSAIEKELNEHIEKKHMSKADIQCKVCQLNFRNEGTLSKHMNTAHLPCQGCSLYYRDLDDLAEHMSITHKTKALK